MSPKQDPPSGEEGYSVRERLASMDDKLDRILTNLHGDGERTGLYTRVDRLEQSELRRNVISGATITAAIGAAIASLWSNMTHAK